MVNADVAEKMRVARADAESLLASGHASANVADALGVPVLCLQPYIDDGAVTVVVAERLGIEPDAAEDLAMRLGKKGRIGLIVALLMAN